MTLSEDSGRGGCCSADELDGTDVVQVAVDGKGSGNERVIADASYIVEDGLLLILDGQPVEVFAFAGARAFADVAEAVGVDKAR